jgi:hypothetical protein
MENGVVNERETGKELWWKDTESPPNYIINCRSKNYITVLISGRYYCINNDGIIDHGRDFSKWDAM